MLAELESARRAWTRVSRDLTDKRKHGKRTCSKCKRLLTLDGFYKRSRGGQHSWCKRCENELRLAWRRAHPEHSREWDAAYNQRRRAKRQA